MTGAPQRATRRVGSPIGLAMVDEGPGVLLQTVPEHMQNGTFVT